MSAGPCEICLSYDASADHGWSECRQLRRVIWRDDVVDYVSQRMVRVNKTWFSA